MSDAEKTEEPTQKKLKDAREKGQVAHSKEMVSALVVLSVSLYFYFFFYHLIDIFKGLIVLPAQFYGQPFDKALPAVANLIWDKTVGILFPIVFIAATVGVLANLLQIGPLFSAEPIVPKFEKIDPVKGFKRIFSMKNLVEFLKSVIKVVALAWACYHVIRANLQDMLRIPVCQESCVPQVLGHMMYELFLYAMAVFCAIALLDFLFQRYQHKKDNRMTKDELKREYKDMEGNPEIKGRRKQIHKEIVSGDAIKKHVKKSSVIITNPTHFAVGLAYSSTDQKLPYVTIKGEALLAQKIKKVAEEEGVPMMENVQLARWLFAEVDEYSYIPNYMLRPVADVIRWVNELRESQGLDPL